MHLDLVTLVVREYDEAIAFFTHVLGFELAEDEPSVTNDGRPKRWVVVRPPGGGTGLLLARADGVDQEERIGDQTGGRVSFFLRVDDFQGARERLVAAAVELGSVWQPPPCYATPRTRAGGVADARKTPSLPSRRRLAITRPGRRSQRPLVTRQTLVGPARDEPYGSLQVFEDPYGNRWDLLGVR